MTSDNSTPSVQPPLRRVAFNRYTALAFVLGIALAVGVTVRAVGVGGGMHGSADVTAHVEHALKHFYVEVDATDAQKAQIDPLVKQAVADLMATHMQLRDAHQHALNALEQTTVDRTALEAARVEHLQLADQASKRIAQLLADVGEVLTPEQRATFADHLEHLRGMPH